jgi:phytoene dehydrogenase-like protein
MSRARRAHLARLERLARTPRPSLRPLTRDELRSMSDAELVTLLAELRAGPDTPAARWAARQTTRDLEVLAELFDQAARLGVAPAEVPGITPHALHVLVSMTTADLR